MPEPSIKYNASLNSFQSMDGSNLTIGGIEQKFGLNKGSVSTFLGGGTDFNSDTDLIFDLKGSMNYNEILNQNLRIRNTIGGDNTATQIRYSPVSVSVPLGKNTSFYANPHYSGKYNYKNNEWTHSAGFLAGVTQKIGNASISLEGQRYNLQDIKDNSGKNWSINAIVNWQF